MRDKPITVRAHAKINLCLTVLGRRTDGYHDLETVMQQLALHDELTFAPAGPGIRLRVDGDPKVPTDSRNLVFRAAALLAETAGVKPAVAIAMRKQVPSSAGLGGGSADAAAALKALNIFWDLRWPPAGLRKLGAALGADVPFALQGGTALARGKGEVLDELPFPGAFGVLLVKPSFGVSTAAVYARYDECGRPPGPGAGALVEALRRGRTDRLPNLLHNALEEVTIAMHPVLGELKDRMRAAGALGSLMAGSGPTIFGLFAAPAAARAAAAAFPDPDLIVQATALLSPSGENLLPPDGERVYNGA